MTQKIIKVGTSAGVILPKATLEKMNLQIGDLIDVDFERTRGEIILRPKRSTASKTDQEIGTIALGIIDRYRSDFEALRDK